MYQDNRCFFCAFETGKGHNPNCPGTLPSKHHYKKIWWRAHLEGLIGKGNYPEIHGLTEYRDVETHTLGWVQGATYG